MFLIYAIEHSALCVFVAVFSFSQQMITLTIK